MVCKYPVHFLSLVFLVVGALFLGAQTREPCSANEVLQITDSDIRCVSVNTLSLAYGDAGRVTTCARHQILQVTDSGLACTSLLSELLKVCGRGHAYFFKTQTPVCRNKTTDHDTALTYATDVISQRNPTQVINPCTAGQLLTRSPQKTLQCTGVQTILQGFCSTNQYLDLSSTTLRCTNNKPPDVAEVPSTPNNIRKTAETRRSVTIAWDVNNRGNTITKTEIKRWNSTCIGTAQQTKTLSNADTTTTFSNLSARTYHIKVRARNRIGWSTWSACTPIEVLGRNTPEQCTSQEKNCCKAPATLSNKKTTAQSCPSEATGTIKTYTWDCTRDGITKTFTTEEDTCVQCGSAQNTCTLGTPVNHAHTTNGCTRSHTWGCSIGGIPRLSCGATENICDATPPQQCASKTKNCCKAPATLSNKRTTTQSCESGATGTRKTYTWDCTKGSTTKTFTTTEDNCTRECTCSTTACNNGCTVARKTQTNACTQGKTGITSHTWYCERNNFQTSDQCTRNEGTQCTAQPPEQCDSQEKHCCKAPATIAKQTKTSQACPNYQGGQIITYTWQCTRNNITKTFTKEENGCSLCDTAPNTCALGVPTGHSQTTNGCITRHTWSCNKPGFAGLNCGATTNACDTTEPACGTTKDTCSRGTLVANSKTEITDHGCQQGRVGTDKTYGWKCTFNGKETGTCTARVQTCTQQCPCSSTGCGSCQETRNTLLDANACSAGQTGRKRYQRTCSKSGFTPRTCTYHTGSCRAASSGGTNNNGGSSGGVAVAPLVKCGTAPNKCRHGSGSDTSAGFRSVCPIGQSGGWSCYGGDGVGGTKTVDCGDCEVLTTSDNECSCYHDSNGTIGRCTTGSTHPGHPYIQDNPSPRRWWWQCLPNNDCSEAVWCNEKPAPCTLRCDTARNTCRSSGECSSTAATNKSTKTISCGDGYTGTKSTEYRWNCGSYTCGPDSVPGSCRREVVTPAPPIRVSCSISCGSTNGSCNHVGDCGSVNPTYRGSQKTKSCPAESSDTIAELTYRWDCSNGSGQGAYGCTQPVTQTCFIDKQQRSTCGSSSNTPSCTNGGSVSGEPTCSSNTARTLNAYSWNCPDERGCSSTVRTTAGCG